MTSAVAPVATTGEQSPVSAPRERTGRRAYRWGIGIGLIGLAIALPYLPIQIPIVFNGPINSPGPMHLLSLMCVMAAVAMTYDLLFGYTGLLSFGHGLYVALGMYTTTVLLAETDLGLGATLLVVLGVGLVAPLALGAVCLRVSGIAFAMVTLAFAQAGAIFVIRDPYDFTGGELGRAMTYEKLPSKLVGVFNAPYRYWLALGLLLLVVVVVRWALASRPGRVWQAIRDNEQRVAVLGLRPYSFKLLAFTLSSFLATLAGAVYALVVGGAHAEVTQATFTLGLLLMAVLGGTGRPYGALIGGMVYTYLVHRLGSLSSSVQELPAVIRAPLMEPLLLLGTLFVLLVLFLPGGLVSIVERPAPDLLRRLRAALRIRASGEGQ
ncbi:MAG TPA: branched-chain amino acid ABC transporter permease [Natronosporangium sp.]|jgi:branched-chain amino acid transport system permease protein|nr:branched-chain amino acid ABC transporter permease [Natronosporangium sp.]